MVHVPCIYVTMQLCHQNLPQRVVSDVKQNMSVFKIMKELLKGLAFVLRKQIR